MKRHEIDWKVIQGAIVVFLISILIFIAVVVTTWHYKDNMLTLYQKNKQSFQGVSNKYLMVDKEERLIKNYYPQFIALYNKGVIGPERRLNWIETLRESGEQIQLPDLRYIIDSQALFEPDYTIDSGGFRVYSSNMRLNIDLLHEGDLVRLLEDLNEHAQGLYNLSRCTLKRRSDKISDDVKRPNISAECELNWFNIKKSDGTMINLS